MTRMAYAAFAVYIYVGDISFLIQKIFIHHILRARMIDMYWVVDV